MTDSQSQPEKKPRSSYKQKRLPAPRQRYYVGEPVVVLSLAKYERLANHLTDVARIDQKTINQQQAIRQRHQAILAETRDDIRAAKKYYQISQTENPDA